MAEINLQSFATDDDSQTEGQHRSLESRQQSKRQTFKYREDCLDPRKMKGYMAGIIKSADSITTDTAKGLDVVDLGKTVLGIDFQKIEIW